MIDTRFCFLTSKVAFDLEIRGDKAIAAEAIAKKPSGKDMFLRHLVTEDEDDDDEDGETPNSQ